ncbi:MAG: AlpA family phage regulatory protein [Proteobacteria bacterium]|nr:AlpA family phage regulatory protein [Pseudomonadota bacterium]
MKDVLRLTSLSRPTLYRRIAAGRFPPPVHLGGRACAWTPKSLELWINDPQGYRITPVVVPNIRRRPGRPRKY